MTVPSLPKALPIVVLIYRPDCTVWQITNTHEIALVSRGKAELITADYIIIATGAIERPMPVKGWTLPGVMSVGGAQTLLKQAALGADDAVFVGSGPLLYLTAWQYIQAGLAVRAVIDITGGKQWRSAIPFAPLALLQPDMLAMGRKWLGDIRRNTEVINKVSALKSSASHRLKACLVPCHQAIKLISTPTIYFCIRALCRMLI